jgi:CRISPR-associated endonuclease/helicase Cas3
MADEEEQFRRFFQAATSFRPYGWQVKAAVEGIPEILPIPTGLGKTEGSVLAWAWRRFARKDGEPLHLVYCLPMRSLVTQTAERLRDCFARLTSWNASSEVSVHRLIGGDDEKWAATPDRPWVLVGTQDMLLSRALNRGYGMNRFDWPVHFGLLNQGCHWIVDEVQLMGPGLWTTAQLDWMRSKRFCALKPCRTTWMSATMGIQFVQTTDRKRDGCDTVAPFDPVLEGDSNEELERRRAARRPVEEFQPEKGKKSKLLVDQIVSRAGACHMPGTLTLIICNTVETAQIIFQKFAANETPKILLTSQFRPSDRREAEETLRVFEARRSTSEAGRIEHSDPGLICVSTQVVEAGLDISAHRLWTEHAPWPSLIQRLGRLNRDGKDNEARAVVWQPATKKRKHDGEDWMGPYPKSALDRASSLLKSLVPLSARKTAAEALAELQKQVPKELAAALAIPLEPCPRALDLHGLFSTEPDLHGGFTDVSRFVRNLDPNADLTVFWRNWPGAVPPERDSLDGPPFDPEKEGCPIAAYRLRDFLRKEGARAWLWNDHAGQWDSIAAQNLRPGMTVMLQGNVGGYDKSVGWSGDVDDRLNDLPPPGSGRTLRDDRRAESGAWSRLASHLSDARREAERLCTALGLQDEDAKLHLIRTSVVEAAGLHDIGKAHPNWQGAVPKSGPLDYEAVAKFPKVLRVEAFSADVETVRSEVNSKLRDILPLPDEVVSEAGLVRLRWALSCGLERDTLKSIRVLPKVRKAVHQAFRPRLRHEAASALAMWRQRRFSNEVPYPALAIYLAAAHHGKVRTVLRAISPEGGDVFGVSRTPEALQFDGKDWPMDFSVAFDGADGDWTEHGFILTGHGWTGLVADLLGPWRGDADEAWTGAVPLDEPRALGPFALAWLEALVRVADWRASDNPSDIMRPVDVVR